MKPVTLILASDEFLASEELDALRAQAVSESFILEEISPEDPQALLYALSTPSLFGDGRFVLVRDAESLPGEVQEAIVEWSENPSPQIAVVLIASGVAGGKLAKRFPAPNVFRTEGVPPWKAAEWSVKRAASKGRKMSRDASAALVEAVGSELRDLASAVDRLCEVTSEPIGVAHVNEHFQGVESRVYQFVDAVFDRDTPLARKRLHALLDQGENKIGLLAALHRQLRIVATVSGGDGRPAADIAKDLGLKSEGAVKRAQRQARGFTLSRIVHAYRLLADADLALKSEEDDPLVLELLVDEISSR
ncbi:MAG: DNA polymerase III subunit delta [Actinomycetota bacterium]